jgi:hypothetical protein
MGFNNFRRSGFFWHLKAQEGVSYAGSIAKIKPKLIS